MYHQRFKTPLQRFEEKVQRTLGCWLWIGAHNELGYGQFYYRGRNRRAHAASKHFYDGFPIDANAVTSGLEWDHLCRNPACVRPDHLELVSRKVNVLRGESPQARNAKKTHCPKGHDLTIHAIKGRIQKHGARSCLLCHKEREKKYYRKSVPNPQIVRKLTWDTANEIRSLLGSLSQAAIAKRFGVSQPAISQIKRGVTWKMK